MKKIKKEYYFIAVLLVIFIILSMFVVGGFTNGFDEFLFNKIIYFKKEIITKPLFVITQAASTLGIISILVITMIVFIKQKKLSDFKYVVINVVTGTVFMQVIKHLIRRPRPSWKWITQGGFSYPSGHTISAFLLYGTLILLVSKRLDGKLKKVLIVIFSLMIVLTGLSRIYFGAHYFTDVLGSIILGSVILIISNSFMNQEFDNDKNKDRKTI